MEKNKNIKKVKEAYRHRAVKVCDKNSSQNTKIKFSEPGVERNDYLIQRQDKVIKNPDIILGIGYESITHGLVDQAEINEINGIGTKDKVINCGVIKKEKGEVEMGKSEVKKSEKEMKSGKEIEEEEEEKRKEMKGKSKGKWAECLLIEDDGFRFVMAELDGLYELSPLSLYSDDTEQNHQQLQPQKLILPPSQRHKTKKIKMIKRALKKYLKHLEKYPLIFSTKNLRIIIYPDEGIVSGFMRAEGVKIAELREEHKRECRDSSRESGEHSSPGRKQSWVKPVVGLSSKTAFFEPDEITEFILAHELAHFASPFFSHNIIHAFLLKEIWEKENGPGSIAYAQLYFLMSEILSEKSKQKIIEKIREIKRKEKERKKKEKQKERGGKEKEAKEEKRESETEEKEKLDKEENLSKKVEESAEIIEKIADVRVQDRVRKRKIGLFVEKVRAHLLEIYEQRKREKKENKNMYPENLTHYVGMALFTPLAPYLVPNPISLARKMVEKEMEKEGLIGDDDEFDIETSFYLMPHRFLRAFLLKTAENLRMILSAERGDESKEEEEIPNIYNVFGDYELVDFKFYMLDENFNLTQDEKKAFALFMQCDVKRRKKRRINQQHELDLGELSSINEQNCRQKKAGQHQQNQKKQKNEKNLDTIISEVAIILLI